MKTIPAAMIVALELVFALVQLAHGYDSAAYKDPHYVVNRTTMVHLFEWKFKDIALECERFLGPMGFAAVQVSPITENVIIKGRPWYERYQPISYNIFSRSGSAEDFGDMVDRCNRVGVRTFVDVVINHMTADVIPSIGVAGSTAIPNKRFYPEVPYLKEHFHPPCAINNYRNAVEVRNCELVGLHDLNQAHFYVKSMIVDFMNDVISSGVAGFRVDAAKHMWPIDLKTIYSKLDDLSTEYFPANTRPFLYQEVIDLGTGEGSRKDDYTYLGDVIEFVYGSQLGRKFRGLEKLSTFETWGFRENGLIDSKDAVVMVDNHDNQRGHGAGGDAILTYKDPRLYKMAVAFMLAHPYGHPRVMSSFDFSNSSEGPPADKWEEIISPDPVEDDVTDGYGVNPCENGWVCEHRWPQIYRMVKFRNVVGSKPMKNWWSNGENLIAFSRGKKGFIAFNGQFGVDLRQELQTGMPPGKYCDIISGRKIGYKCSGKTVIVKSGGLAYIKILKDDLEGVLAIHVKSRLPHSTKKLKQSMNKYRTSDI